MIPAYPGLKLLIDLTVRAPARRLLRTVRVARVLGVCGTAMLVWGACLDVEARQDRPRPALNWVGVTGHAWGGWVLPGVEVEDWVEDARALCAPEEYCEVNVFEGTELVTHEYPVPEANRRALKWVFLYRHNETPRIVVEEAHATPGGEKRRWTFQ